ncbi:LPS-assembly protein LptD [Novosphingobium ovatum]|nr:LPS assembly protein LptD [Novosphingobium ovatum]
MPRPTAQASLLALALGLCPALAPGLAYAQAPGAANAQTPSPPPSAMAPTPPPAADDIQRKIDFEADTVDYDTDHDTVTATGRVFLRQTDRTVRADKVVWNRKTGQVIASGGIRVVDGSGNELLTERMELTDDLAMATTENMLMLMREGGRLAAATGQREADGTLVLRRVAYTGCDVVDAEGCPKKATWQVTAARVVYLPEQKLVRFHNASLAVFGLRILPLPTLRLATDGRAISGLLMPDLRHSATNGFELSSTYYKRLADDRDLALTGYVFTKAQPMIKAHYRALTDIGAYQVTGYVTQSTVIPVSGDTASASKQLRGYLDANGRFQFTPEWSLNFSGRLASDRTFLSRYYISGDDLLRSTISAERVGERSYLSITGWAFQTLRTNEVQGLVPVALPVVDWRLRPSRLIAGGTVEFQANSLAITRTAGEDVQRAFASARWDMRRITPWGQVVTLTGLVRGDAYHSSDNALTTTTTYRGLPGWQTRAVALGAVDVKWPLVGSALGGTQVLTPHFQIVAAPATRNLAIPNEDARAIELEDSNLFALNRFPGYDRIEDGTRFTYGLEWQLERPRWRVNAVIGQSYRLSADATLFPNGTGLSARTSDIVGRTEIRYRDLIKLTHRYRIDKDSYVFRRNEVDAAVGSDRTYFELGYARLNRNIDSSLEDLSDSNEARATLRVAFARYWSVFGSGVFDLSNTNLVTNTRMSSFQPLRTRLGVSFQSDCFQLDFTWRRDYVTIGDAARGSSFELHFAIRNLGFH